MVSTLGSIFHKEEIRVWTPPLPVGIPNITKPNGIYLGPRIKAWKSVVRAKQSSSEPGLRMAYMLGKLVPSYPGLERQLVPLLATLVAMPSTHPTGQLHANSRGYNQLPIIRPCLPSWQRTAMRTMWTTTHIHR